MLCRLQTAGGKVCPRWLNAPAGPRVGGGPDGVVGAGRADRPPCLVWRPGWPCWVLGLGGWAACPSRRGGPHVGPGVYWYCWVGRPGCWVRSGRVGLAGQGCQSPSRKPMYTTWAGTNFRMSRMVMTAGVSHLAQGILRSGPPRPGGFRVHQPAGHPAVRAAPPWWFPRPPASRASCLSGTARTCGLSHGSRGCSPRGLPCLPWGGADEKPGVRCPAGTQHTRTPCSRAPSQPCRLG